MPEIGKALPAVTGEGYYSVPCPRCGVKAGHRCTRNGRPKVGPHQARVSLLARVEGRTRVRVTSPGVDQ